MVRICAWATSNIQSNLAITTTSGEITEAFVVRYADGWANRHHLEVEALERYWKVPGMVLDDIFRGFLTFGFYFCITLAIAQFSRNAGKRHLATATLFICVGVLLIANVNVNARYEYFYPQFATMEVPFIFALGPAMFIIVAETLEAGQHRYWKHFVLPALAVIPILYYYFDASTVIVSPFHGEHEMTKPYYLIYIVAFGGMFAYSVKIMSMLGESAFSLRIISAESSIRYFFMIAFYALAVLFFAVIAIAAGSLTLIRLSMVFMTLGVVGAFLHGMHHADFYENLSEAVEATKRSRLSNIDLDQLGENLANLMEEEQAYLNPDLTLPVMASKLDVSSHQLSEYLNTILKKSFSQFVNTYRVEKAKLAIKGKDRLSLLAIGYQSGFNSKQSFIRRFKSTTNMTPMQYRKLHEAKS